MVMRWHENNVSCVRPFNSLRDQSDEWKKLFYLSHWLSYPECSLIAPIFAVLYRDDTTFNAATPTKPYRQAETSITEVLNERKQGRYSSHVFTVTPETRKVLESVFAFVCVANKSCHLKVILLLFFTERISARKIDFLYEKSNTQCTCGSQWSYCSKRRDFECLQLFLFQKSTAASSIVSGRDIIYLFIRKIAHLTEDK